MAREGDPAPGFPDGVVVDQVSAVLGDNGHAAVQAILTGAGVDNTNGSGLYRASPGDGLTLVARQGSRAAGTEPDTSYRSFRSLAVNARGQVAYEAGLVGASVTAGNDVGLYGTDPLGRPRLVLREGDVLSVGGSEKVVRSIFTNRDTSESLPGTVLNDSGKLAYVAWFTDNTNAIFVTDLSAASITDTFTVPAGESFDIPGGLQVEPGSALVISDGSSLTTPDFVIDADSRVDVGNAATVRAERLTNNGVFAGNLAISGTQTYGGAGILEGMLAISGGGTQSPGNSPGVQTMETLQWGGGGVLEFELADAHGEPGIGWDLIEVTDALEITASETDPFTIKLATLGGNELAGPAAGFDPGQDFHGRSSPPNRSPVFQPPPSQSTHPPFRTTRPAAAGR